MSSEDDSYITYDCEIEEGDETTFTVGCNNAVTFNLGSLEDCVAAKTGNIVLESNEDAVSVIKSYNLTFSIPEDTSNDTHKKYTMIPFLITYGGRTNPLLLAKKATGSTVADAIKNAFTQLSASGDTMDSFEVSSSESVKTTSPLSESLNLSVSDMQMKALCDSNGNVLFDGDSALSGLKFIYKKEKGLFSSEIIASRLAIVFFRHYLNEGDDYLRKNIVTMNIGAFINPTLTIGSGYKSYTTSILGEFNGTVDNGSSSGDTASTGSTLSAATSGWSQTIKFDFNYAINADLEDPGNLSAMALIGKDTLSNPTMEKVDKGFYYMLEITFRRDVTEKKKLDENSAELYLKRSNGLIYRFKNITLKNA
jgi:hypothetical protein